MRSFIRDCVPADINMMALTATATRKLRLEVCQVLGMKDPTLKNQCVFGTW